MEHARRHIPARARLQAIGLGQVGDLVVALVPDLQAVAHLLLRRARLQAEEGVGEGAAVVVELGRVEIGLRFRRHPHQLGVLLALVQVVGQRVPVVEEFRVHGPLAVGVPQLLAQQLGAQLADHVHQQHFFGLAALFVDDVAQALVGRGQRPVVGLGGGGKPAFVDAAAVGAKRVIVARVQLDAPARDAKRAGHPGGGKAQDAFALFICFADHKLLREYLREGLKTVHRRREDTKEHKENHFGFFAFLRASCVFVSQVLTVLRRCARLRRCCPA